MQSTREAGPSSPMTLRTSAKRKGGYFPRKFFWKISFPYSHFRHAYSRVFLCFCTSSLHTFFLMSLFLIFLSQVQCLPLPASTAFNISTAPHFPFSILLSSHCISVFLPNPPLHANAGFVSLFSWLAEEFLPITERTILLNPMYRQICTPKTATAVIC